MGDGVGIIPTSETIVAPAPATVTSLIEDSKHAIGLTLKNGIEVLIHVGIDTVEMKGQGFAYKVKEGQTVEAGQPLLTFSRKDIKAAGHPDTVLMIVTEDNGVSGITMQPGQDLKAGEGDVTTW
jgi:PTS system trehalose-specific IIC component